LKLVLLRPAIHSPIDSGAWRIEVVENCAPTAYPEQAPGGATDQQVAVAVELERVRTGDGAGRGEVGDVAGAVDVRQPPTVAAARAGCRSRRA
jgi:hypothetical protein